MANHHEESVVSLKLLVGLIVLCTTAALVYLINGAEYFGGDLSLAQSIQHWLHGDVTWAVQISTLASFPWYFVLLLMSMVVAFLGSGRRAAEMALASFAGLWAIDKLLRLVVFQPRPYVELINVPFATHGSAFPSTAAIIYGATFGFLLLLSLSRFQNAALKWGVALVSALALLAVFLARIVLGAHWPSDILVTFLICGLWASLLIAFVPSSVPSSAPSSKAG